MLDKLDEAKKQTEKANEHLKKLMLADSLKEINEQ